MSQALCDVVPIMELLQEMNDQEFKVLCADPQEYCKILKTILAPLSWLGFPSYTLGPNTSMYATITFVNMGARGSSKYPLLIPRTRLLMLSPSPWHKKTFHHHCVASHVRQVTSTSYQSEGVLHIGNPVLVFFLDPFQSCLFISARAHPEQFEFIVYVFQAQHVISRQN